MYATSKSVCPVKSFEKYIFKQNPNCLALFQRTKIARKDAKSLDVWYYNQVISLNTLTMKMKVISVKAGLLRVHTNIIQFEQCQ